jgi:hypothetical protein
MLSKLDNIKNLINIILISLFLSSCATLYTGEDIPKISLEKLHKKECSATFRFLDLRDFSNANFNTVSFRVSNVHNSELYLRYINDLNIFKEVKIIDFPLPSIEINSDKQLDDFLSKNNPEIVTDYFIDVQMTRPFTNHGTGLGMYGGLLSAVTLGILPAWWTHETDFKIYVYKQGKRVENLNFKNNYNSFSSILFYLVPGNETSINGGNKLMIPHKNEINYIIQNLSEKLCQK